MSADRGDRRIALGMLACLTALVLWVTSCTHGASANPVERVTARCRVVSDGRFGVLAVGGTVDSVEYFPGEGYAARRDSAELWVQIDGGTSWPAESSAVYGSAPAAAPTLDAFGTGQFTWVGRVTGFGLYRADWANAPLDTMRRGTGQRPFLLDDGAVVRATFASNVLTDVAAWGTETCNVLDPDGYGVDQGATLEATADTTQLQFTAPARAGGLRYVLRTRAAWTSGTDRWLRLEVTRDTTILGSILF